MGFTLYKSFFTDIDMPNACPGCNSLDLCEIDCIMKISIQAERSEADSALLDSIIDCDIAETFDMMEKDEIN